MEVYEAEVDDDNYASPTQIGDHSDDDDEDDASIVNNDEAIARAMAVDSDENDDDEEDEVVQEATAIVPEEGEYEEDDDDDDPSSPHHHDSKHRNETTSHHGDDDDEDGDGDGDGDDHAGGEDDVMAAVVLEDDDDDDHREEDVEDDDDDVQEATEVVAEATVIVEDDDDNDDDDDDPTNGAQVEETAVEVVVAEEGKKSTRKRRKPQSSSSSSRSKSSKTTTSRNKKGKKVKRKIKVKRRKKSPASNGVSEQRLEAASKARQALTQAVPRLPVVVSDTHIVRNFGRLKMKTTSRSEGSGKQDNSRKTSSSGTAAKEMAVALESPFQNHSALYPVGFSCDRFEYSPVHGRILKIRCTILDGSKVSQKLKDTTTTSKNMVDAEYINYKGPIFRVMWGQGIDDDVESMDFPYDPYASSSPIIQAAENGSGSSSSGGMKKGKSHAAPGGDKNHSTSNKRSKKGSSTAAGSTTASPIVAKIKEEEHHLTPEVGMRVKVRFDKDAWYGGIIVHVGEEEEDKKKKKTKIEICIQYDDGSTEDAYFPDPDVALQLPGSEEENTLGDEGVDVTEYSGKAVTTTSGKTPLEAWGKALIKLGLVDEIIFEAAFEALAMDRIKGKADAKDKAAAQRLHRQQARQRKQSTGGESEAGGDDRSTAIASPVPSSSAGDQQGSADAYADAEPVVCAEDDSEKIDTVEGIVEADGENQEPATEEEDALRAKVNELQKQLESSQQESRVAAIALADARISSMGPFLANPFREVDPEDPQMSSWLATVIRKEKAKMGSTGNRKKVVTRTDLLERNDTFYNADIEKLLEGLPGSEYTPHYVFQGHRAGGAAALSQAWLHEAQERQEKEREKHLKSAKEAALKASQLREKEVKKRKREDARDERKRQKLEEVEQKKRARVEERLSRLNVQVEERLFKEACFQREKVILLLSKSLGKEFARRRKMAEMVAGNAILSQKNIRKDVFLGFNEELPPLGKIYDEDVVRVWDFVSSFGKSFVKWGFLPSVPTIDSLQGAIDDIRGADTLGNSIQADEATKLKAIDSLTDLAVALSKPLGANITKLLFSSLIALNPGLQKDYGASFFAEINAPTQTTSNGKKKEEGSLSSSPVLLPVNRLTWQEVARVAFISDALGELGFSRQEAAHLLRGYRSGGHPNSKEAKRLRRTEDFSINLLRQIFSEGGAAGSAKAKNNSEQMNRFSIRVHTPCEPSVFPTDWIFYLHNVNMLSTTATSAMKTNIRKALALIKSSSNNKDSTFSSDLEKSLAMLEKNGKTDQSDSNSASKAKQLVLRVLDRATGEKFSSEYIGEILHEDTTKMVSQKTEEKNQLESARKSFRSRMGLLSSLSLTAQEYKDLVHRREEYMSEALRLKEEMERKEKAEDEEDDDDDDEDDDDDDNENNEDKKQDNESSKSDKTVEDEKKKEEEEDSQGENKDNENSEINEKTPKKDEGKDEKDEGKETETEKKESKKESEDNDTSSEVVATVIDNNDNEEKGEETEDGKIGKETPYDEFCGDLPKAPELIRRCLAVLRTLCLAGPAEPFIYPIDPQTNPGYYEALLKPMCLQEVGKILQEAGKLYLVDNQDGKDVESEIEDVVAQFGRNVRLIAHNCSAYPSAGASIISSSEEMMRIFERLFLDWVLVPEDLLQPLEFLDDDRCVEHHVTDEDSMVLLCDGCEGNYNMSRLTPPLKQVPKGDWYCPRCLEGRCWESLDPRIGKKVKKPSGKGTVAGVIEKSMFSYSEGPGSKPSLLFLIKYDDGAEEKWTVKDVDDALSASGEVMKPLRCLEAVAESPGYGFGTDYGPRVDLVPAPVNPGVSDAAAQASLSSTVFGDTIAGSASLLLINPEEMTASEWLRLLLLLVMKCSSSEMLQKLASTMEEAAAENMAKRLQEVGQVAKVSQILPSISDDEDDEDEESEDSMEIDEDEKVPDVKDSEDEEWKDPDPTKGKKKLKEEGNEVKGQASDGVAVVHANAIEVVSEEEATPIEGSTEVPSSAATAVVSAESVKVEPALTEEELRKKQRVAALAKKDARQKAREDSIAANCIKMQIRPSVASFEEDTVTQVIESSLTSTESGISYMSCRSRGMVCDFCGLSDTALGTQLVRVPNQKEWNELMPHSSRSRRILLVADVGSQAGSDDGNKSREMIQPLSNDSVPLSPIRAKKKKKRPLVTVSIRIGGELVSVKDEEDYFDGVKDGGMLEFLPRNEDGFQKELEFRANAELPITTGSLSAHECCAVAAHAMRKDKLVQEYKEKQSIIMEKECGMDCGRTLSLGTDSTGRSFWKYSADPDSLFVCSNDALQSISEITNKKWRRIALPEEIASVMVCLGKQEVVKTLKRAFPHAASLLKNGKWSNLLQRRLFKSSRPAMANLTSKSTTQNTPGAKIDDSQSEEKEAETAEEMPYTEGEEVLVESKSGKLLWDAVVTGVSHEKSEEKVNGYRVRYKKWSSRFDEWVDPLRVVEPTEYNVQVQEEMLEELVASKEGIPAALEHMAARKYVEKRDRVRGSLDLPNFVEISKVPSDATSEEKAFGLVKAALLLVEAALPLGCVDNSTSGPWRPAFAAQWRSAVQEARGPTSIMRCALYLEDSLLASESLDEQTVHLLSCMPIRWKAINEASTSSLALRIFLLDQGIRYGAVDRSRYLSSGRKKGG